MSLRFVSPADAEALEVVHAAAFDTPWKAADIARLMQAMGGFAIAAEDAAGGVQGFILARVMADEAEILTLAVRPEARRQGIGGALVEAAAAEGARRGAAVLLLEVAADNPAALGLYQGQGFSRVGLRKAYYARPGAHRADALVLRRPLNREGA